MRLVFLYHYFTSIRHTSRIPFSNTGFDSEGMYQVENYKKDRTNLKIKRWQVSKEVKQKKIC
jgi:hypothetical protein